MRFRRTLREGHTLYDSSADPIDDPPNPTMPTWIPTSPVQVACNHNVRWMEQYSNDDDVTLLNRGTMQDWMVFFWNVWSNGANRFSVDELTDIWYRTPCSDESIDDSDTDWCPGHVCDIGETWGDLVDDVEANYAIGKRNQFTGKGNSAGVDGTIY
jgi:hypothetical protein